MKTIKFIVKYLRLLELIGITHLRMITYEKHYNQQGKLTIYDIAECNGWLRKDKNLRLFAKNLIQHYIKHQCIKIKIESINEDDPNINLEVYL